MTMHISCLLMGVSTLFNVISWGNCEDQVTPTINGSIYKSDISVLCDIYQARGWLSWSEGPAERRRQLQVDACPRQIGFFELPSWEDKVAGMSSAWSQDGPLPSFSLWSNGDDGGGVQLLLGSVVAPRRVAEERRFLLVRGSSEVPEAVPRWELH